MHFHGYTHDQSNLDKAPALIPWWLRKPARSISNTSDTPEEAMAWIEALYRPMWGSEGRARPMYGLSVDEMLQASLDSLRSGRDVMLDRPLTSNHPHIFVICCPNFWEEIPCPLGRTDSWPDGLVRIVSIKK